MALIQVKLKIVVLMTENDRSPHYRYHFVKHDKFLYQPTPGMVLLLDSGEDFRIESCVYDTQNERFILSRYYYVSYYNDHDSEHNKIKKQFEKLGWKLVEPEKQTEV